MPPKARPPPDLKIPSSKDIVKLSVIDSTTDLDGIPCTYFYEPKIKGHENWKAPSYCFLIEHATSGKRLMFDLGVRQDIHNHAPSVLKLLRPWKISVEKNTSEILVEGGIPLESIDTIIWSHRHFDHTGDPSKFPTSTDLVVGPNFKKFVGEGYPHEQDSPCTASAWEGRNFIELDYATDSRATRVGRFRAIDWFEDGSFYLLETPGHTSDHICGLARTRLGTHPAAVDGQDEFVFLGGDLVHHCGEHRPNPYEPIPENIYPDPRQSEVSTSSSSTTSSQATPQTKMSSNKSESAPGEFFAACNVRLPAGSDDQWNEPFVIPTKVHTDDFEQTMWSIAGLEEFDSQRNIFVLSAHDATLADRLVYFPHADLANWREKGLNSDNRWRFLVDFQHAHPHDKPSTE